MAQVSAMSQTELEKVHVRIEKVLPAMMIAKKVDMILVMLTDIMSESSTLVYCGEGAETLVKGAFVYQSSDSNSIVVDGMVSRKKQLVPALMKTLTERAN